MKKTPLNEVHRQAGARMVEFGGWDMPVQYAGVIAEHLAVRQDAGLFDVSHMGEIAVSGVDALDFLQYTTINDVSSLVDGQVQYSALCYPDGGVVDDLTVYRFDQERFMLCVNAANSDKDFAWLKKLQAESRFAECEVHDKSSEYAQIALQGPKAEQILARATDLDLTTISTYFFAAGHVAGAEAVVSRTGYTGEDGFELYLAPDAAVTVWRALMQLGGDDGLVQVGLGARDTLRLEKAYALYGHEITAEILPLEARLGWITKLGKDDFVGREALLAAKEQGLKRNLIGLELSGPGVPREGYRVECGGEDVGYVTSGTMSPSLRRGIALALVKKEFADADDFDIVIRNRAVTAKRKKLPFV
ncbi:MAG: glycine cleavage system aminomethyltransferase GcvT [Desulfuromonadales bacterium]|nr:glycine cleavage system aminomethyltransferase GcvT [Desulfuromonadales bacterium]